MFSLIAILPLVYTLLASYSGFPLREQIFDERALQNESLVVFLGLNLIGVQEFDFFAPIDRQVSKHIIFLFYFLQINAFICSLTRLHFSDFCKSGQTVFDL